MNKAQKYMFVVAATAIAIFSGFGFYLINGQPKIESLAASGHVHLLLFAYGAILFGLLIDKAGIADRLQKKLAIWMSLTFLGPLGLIYAGISGDTSMLRVLGVVFEGSFVVLWFILAYYLAAKKSK